MKRTTRSRAGIAALATGALVMGACVAGAGTASADPGFAFERVAGQDRYATSAEAAEQFGSADHVILASGEEGHYPDALAANYLAGAFDAPILLTRQARTPDPVLKQLRDMGVERITIVGGPAAVGTAQEKALRAAGYTVDRVAGQNRFATNEEILEERNTSADTALIATGTDFPDALAGGPLSYAEGLPLAITRTDDMPDGIVDALLDAGIDKAIVLGGENAVGAAVVKELEDNGITVVARLAGRNRSGTAAAVARYAVGTLGFAATGVSVASGDPALDGADALSAGPVAGSRRQVLLVTTNADKAGDSLLGFLYAHVDSLTGGYLFGGSNAVASAVRQQMTTVARDAATYSLTLLHANDLESQLIGIDAPAAAAAKDAGESYDTDKDGDGRKDYGGVDRFATVVDQLRTAASTGDPRPGEADDRAALVVSAGDNFLAGPELSASQEEGNPFYDALGMKLTGFDASAIGNHEFDFGPDFFARFVQAVDGAFPFVSANLDFSKEAALQALVDSGDIVQDTVVEKAGSKIGLVGLTTPELPSVSSPGDVTVDEDLAGIAQQHVDALTEQGIDKIVLVSHLQDIDNERALAGMLHDVDVVVGGGGGELVASDDDLLIPGDQRSTNPDTGQPYQYPIVEQDAEGTSVPIVTTPGEYAYVGQLAVSFDADGHVVPGSWVPYSGPVRVSGVGADGVEPDPEVNEQVVQPVAAHIADLESQVVANSEVGLVGVREEVRTRETNLGALLADALLRTGRAQAEEYDVEQPQIAIENGGGIRNDSVIPAGEVTRLDTFSIAPFPNFVAVMPDVPCTSIKELLERGVAALPQPAGQFIQVAGLDVSYDVSKQAQEMTTDGTITTPGDRIRSVTLVGPDGTQDIAVVENGEVVDGCQPITLATNDFSARGGDNYPIGQYPFTNVGTTYQQSLEGYLRELGTVTSEKYSKEAVAGRISPVS